jgi:hypothetical protein
MTVRLNQSTGPVGSSSQDISAWTQEPIMLRFQGKGTLLSVVTTPTHSSGISGQTFPDQRLGESRHWWTQQGHKVFGPRA